MADKVVTREQFSEQVSLLRKYAYEFACVESCEVDNSTYDAMINAQVALHKMFESQQAEITRLNAIIKENEADAKRYRFIRAGFTRSNKLVVAIDSDIPSGIKRYLDIHLDETLNEAMRVKGE